MYFRNLEENYRKLKLIFPGEGVSCLCITGATIMTLLVLFQLSVIW